MIIMCFCFVRLTPLLHLFFTFSITFYSADTYFHRLYFSFYCCLCSGSALSSLSSSSKIANSSKKKKMKTQTKRNRFSFRRENPAHCQSLIVFRTKNATVNFGNFLIVSDRVTAPTLTCMRTFNL